MFEKPAKNKFYIRTGFIFIAIGLIGLGFPFLSLGFLNELALLDSLAQSKELDLKQLPNPNGQFVQPGQVITTPIPDYNLKSVKNRLVIKNIGVNMPIVLSDSANTLWRSGWIFPGTSTPDQGGNTVIFGHRFRYLPPVSNTFYHLDKTKVGDEFTISWQGKEYRYKVTETKVIEPTDFSVITPSTNSRITLITCAPLFSTEFRLVVVGELIQ